MKNRLNFVRCTVASVCLAWAATSAQAAAAPMTPELAAKAARVKEQMQQRITPAKRKAAAQALKAQRERVHRARIQRTTVPAFGAQDAAAPGKGGNS